MSAADGYQPNPDWIAVDWGTSALRIWAMQADCPIEARQAQQGMNLIAADAFEHTFLKLAGDWVAGAVVPVIACGMVGSRQGWAEAPYLQAPTKTKSALVHVNTASDQIRVAILPGVKQLQPADVMRGEETQIAGLLAKDPDFDGVVCLPGTHTKWVRISAGEICHFQTAMTGELFDLLASHSVLRHSLDQPSEDWDAEIFATSVEETLTRPERLATALFSIRATGLLAGLDGAAARARLSGLLIGAELAATKPYWLGQNIAIIGAPELARIYAAGLQSTALPATIYDATELTLAGLYAAYKESFA